MQFEDFHRHNRRVSAVDVSLQQTLRTINCVACVTVTQVPVREVKN